jgi:predicted Zn-dependent peptidase
MRRQAVIPALCAVLLATVALAADIPPRPEQLTYPALTFDVPDAEAMRVQLANGVPVYLAEDRLLPLVTIQVHFRGGSYLEPAGKQGLAGLTGTVWRSGGAGALDAKALDEELDYLAAQLSTSVGAATGMVSLNLLAKDLDRGLALLLDVLQNRASTRPGWRRQRTRCWPR